MCNFYIQTCECKQWDDLILCHLCMWEPAKTNQTCVMTEHNYLLAERWQISVKSCLVRLRIFCEMRFLLLYYPGNHDRLRKQGSRRIVPSFRGSVPSFSNSEKIRLHNKESGLGSVFILLGSVEMYAVENTSPRKISQCGGKEKKKKNSWIKRHVEQTLFNIKIMPQLCSAQCSIAKNISAKNFIVKVYW